MPSFRNVLTYMGLNWRAYAGLIAGLCFASLMWNGVAAWIPTHFIRQFGWTPTQVGLRYGLVLMVFGTCGILCGSWVSGRLQDRGWTDANVRVGMISALAALPFGVVAPLLPNAAASLSVFACYLFAGAMPYGAAAAAFQHITPNRMRGQVSAIYLFWLNLAGIGLGPTLVAGISQWVFGGDMGISRAIATDVAIAAPLSALLFALTFAPYRRALQSADRAAIA
jgi:MFS family permease